MAELGPGSRRGVGFLSLSTLATNPPPPPAAICPGRRMFCPPGLPYLITRRASPDPALPPPPPHLSVARLPWA